MTAPPLVLTTAELAEYHRTGRLPQAPTRADAPPSAKRSKYGVGPRHSRQLDGYTFDSIAEKRHYEELRLRQRAGEIGELRVHPSWPLVVNDVVIGEYEADFSYRDVGTWALHVVDVKGMRLAVYRMKKALMLALHGIEVEEVTARAGAGQEVG